jgi:hypothetical protein
VPPGELLELWNLTPNDFILGYLPPLRCAEPRWNPGTFASPKVSGGSNDGGTSGSASIQRALDRNRDQVPRDHVDAFLNTPSSALIRAPKLTAALIKRDRVERGTIWSATCSNLNCCGSFSQYSICLLVRLASISS